MTDVDEKALAGWLRDRLPGCRGPVTARKFPKGQSNPTYLVEVGAENFVMRRKPFGQLLPSAHAIEREFRLLSALHPRAFPVPRPIVFCEDAQVIGAAFYLMEMVEGRGFVDGTLPDLQPAERRPAYDATVRTLAELHNIDHEAAGLSDFGRPGNFCARQIDRWARQYRASQTDQIPEMDKLIDWLGKTVPSQDRTVIIHGDYRIDNLIYSGSAPDVVAVLDWELATLGDPLADFAYFAMNWAIPVDGRSGLAGIDLVERALPSLQEVTDRYCQLTDRPGIPNLNWYFAFNFFKVAAILQGVKKRMQAGNASNRDDAAATSARITPFAQAAWHHAQIAR